MIIWLNGAFGAGKTQTACELHRRLPGSCVYDPENAGFFLRDNLPPGLAPADFQDHPLWRSFNRELLDDIASRFDGHVIVPMTLTVRAYYDELVAPLAEKHDLRHIILQAGEATLRKRLASRFERPSSWAHQQIPRCLRAFASEIPGQKIDTDGLTLGQVVHRVGALCGLPLLPDRRGPLRRLAERAVTQLRHIR